MSQWLTSACAHIDVRTTGPSMNDRGPELLLPTIEPSSGLEIDFPKANGPFQLIYLRLAGLGLKPRISQIRSQHRKNLVTFQALVVDFGGYFALVLPENGCSTSSTKPGGGSVLGKVENLAVL